MSLHSRITKLEKDDGGVGIVLLMHDHHALDAKTSEAKAKGKIVIVVSDEDARL